MTGAGSWFVPERGQGALKLPAPKPGEWVSRSEENPGVGGIFPRSIGGGTYLGLDRSPTATAAAAARHADAAGRATFHRGDVDTARLPAAAFDAILAVNVNRFWTSDPSPVLERMREWLRPGGRVVLVWEPPGASRADQIAELVPPVLEAARYAITLHRATTATGASLVGVLGRVD